jgi:hypothetical protein
MNAVSHFLGLVALAQFQGRVTITLGQSAQKSRNINPESDLFRYRDLVIVLEELLQGILFLRSMDPAIEVLVRGL